MSVKRRMRTPRPRLAPWVMVLALRAVASARPGLFLRAIPRGAVAALLLLAALQASARQAWASESEERSTGTEVHGEGPPQAVSNTPPSLLQGTSSAEPAPVVFSKFPGIFGGGTLARPHPSDDHGSVGPFGILQVVNKELGYFRRSGIAVFPARLLDLFFPTTGSLLDPQAHYDPATGRYFISAIEPHKLPPGPYFVTLWVAVSKSSDPLTANADDWYFYHVDATETIGSQLYGGDFPQMGLDESALYVSLNMFSLPFDGFEVFLHARIFAFDKVALTNGTLISKSVAAPDFGPFTLQPATVLGSPAPPPGIAYFAEVVSSSTTRLRVWALSDPLGTPTLSSALVAVPNHGGPISNAPQCGTPMPLATFGSRAQANAFWRDGSLWLCHNAGGGAGRAIVYYYRVLTNGFPVGTPTLAESAGIDGGPGVWNFLPSIGGNEQGDVALVFLQSSATECPTVMTTARRAGATAFPDPVPVLVSPTYYNGLDTTATDMFGGRLGDYAAVSFDPIDSTLWVTHDFANGTTAPELWGTVWANVQLRRDPGGWRPDGVAVRSSLSPVSRPLAVADGSGGTYLAWADGRPTATTFAWHLFVQHLTPAGAVAPGWTDGGTDVGSLPGPDPVKFSLAPDGSGGLYVARADFASTWLHRLTASGAPADGWPAGGLQVATAAATSLQVTGDGSGGALIAWSRAGIKVQRVNPSATVLWGSGGLALASTGGSPQLVADGSGGAIVVWSPSVRIQHVDAPGSVAWTAGGIPLASSGVSARVASDAAGGCFVLYEKTEPDLTQNLYLLRVLGSSGTLAPGWPAGGWVVTASGSHPADATLVADGAAGALCAWTDDRDVATTGLDVYASRLTASGALAAGWPSGGRTVCRAVGDQSVPALSADGNGGCAVAWEDHRGDSGDIYSMVIERDATPDPEFPAGGLALCTLTAEQGTPSLARLDGGSFAVAWLDSRLDPGCQFSDPCTGGIYAHRVLFDSSPPAAVTDLTAAMGRTTALLSWTESGDDGTAGTASGLDLRYSIDPISSEAGFASAAQVYPAPPTLGPGAVHCQLLSGLETCTSYYFAIKTVDDAGNWSPIGNVRQGTTHCSGQTEMTCDTGLPNGPGSDAAPRSLELGAPTPNPADNGFTLRFGVPLDQAGQAYECGLFDVAGRRVVTFARGRTTAGYHSLRLERSTIPRGLPAGRYYVRLDVGARHLTTGLVLLR